MPLVPIRSAFPLACLLFLLSACGGSPDETSPALTLDAFETLTNQTSVTLSGTIESGATLELEVGSRGAVAIPYSGDTWTTEVDGLQEGSNVLSLTATDKIGNLRMRSFVIVVDQTPPELSSLQPAEGAEVSPETEIVLVFSEKVEVDTLLPALRVAGTAGEIAGTLNPQTGSADTIAFQPEAPLDPGTVEVFLEDAVRDEAGNFLLLEEEGLPVESRSWSFTVVEPAP